MVRKYNTNYAANILGYIGVINNLNPNNSYYESGDRIGKSGIDKSYEQTLRGKKGVKHILQDVTGKQMPYKNGLFDTLSIPGRSITLTLDLELQEFGEKIMQNYNGSIVAIEPSTGEMYSRCPRSTAVRASNYLKETGLRATLFEGNIGALIAKSV